MEITYKDKEIIATFMNFTVNGDHDNSNIINEEKEAFIDDADYLSWNYLIPVIRKIVTTPKFYDLKENSDEWAAYYAIEDMIVFAEIVNIIESVLVLLRYYYND